MGMPLPEISLDRQVALSRVGGDVELLKEIAVLFIEDYPNSIAELRAGIARGDAKAIERAAHGLKGSVANFGAPAAAEAARSLEASGRSQQLAGVGAMLAKLEEALAALRIELESL